MRFRRRSSSSAPPGARSRRGVPTSGFSTACRGWAPQADRQCRGSGLQEPMWWLLPRPLLVRAMPQREGGDAGQQAHGYQQRARRQRRCGRERFQASAALARRVVDIEGLVAGRVAAHPIDAEGRLTLCWAGAVGSVGHGRVRRRSRCGRRGSGSRARWLAGAAAGRTTEP